MIVGIEQLVLPHYRRDKVIPPIDPWIIEQTRQYGQITPVVVRAIDRAQYEILTNAESWLCVQRAGLHNVEVVVREGITDAHAQKIVNNRHAGDPVAEAEWFRACLRDKNTYPSITDLAHALKRTRTYISHSLRLLTLGPEIQTGLRVGALKVGHAKALLSVAAGDARQRLAIQIIQGRWTVRRAEQATRELTGQGSGAAHTRTAKSATTRSLERGLGDLIGSQVDIDESGGTLTIDYRGNLEVLDGLLERLGYKNP